MRLSLNLISLSLRKLKRFKNVYHLYLEQREKLGRYALPFICGTWYSITTRTNGTGLTHSPVLLDSSMHVWSGSNSQLNLWRQMWRMRVSIFFPSDHFFIFRILFYFLYSRFLLVIYSIHSSVYMSIPISQFITPPPPHFPPLVSIRLFSTSVSLFLPCKPVHLYHFSRLHIYAIIYGICFSLSDLLHSVWQSLGPSTSL